MAIALAALLLTGCGSRPAPGRDAPGAGTPGADAPAADTSGTPPAGTPAPAGGVGGATPGAVAVGSAGDPLRDQQWGLDATGLPASWTAATGEGVVIAIVDTGIDLDHPDLAGRLVPGIDLVDGDGVPDDPNGHGTHVAGIAAAATGNGVGIAGGAPGARLMPVRVLDEAGGDDDDGTITEGIRWAAEQGADVINLSLGEEGLGDRLSRGGALNAAIRAASAEGAVVVAAAGNEGQRERAYRVGVPVLVVGAVGEDGTIAGFSNTGDARAVVAPGEAIQSTVPVGASDLFGHSDTGYAPLDGTSMAAPFAAALAALLLGAGHAPADVPDRIARTAANPGGDPRLGSGLIDGPAALGLTDPVAPGDPAAATPRGAGPARRPRD